jgi:hypothetical protein
VRTAISAEDTTAFSAVMSSAEQGEGLATVEDITIVCLGIWLPKVFGKQDGKMFVSSERRGRGGRSGS